MELKSMERSTRCPVCHHVLISGRTGGYCRHCNLLFSAPRKSHRRRRKSLVNFHFS